MVKRIGPPTNHFMLYFISSKAEENMASNNTLHALFFPPRLKIIGPPTIHFMLYFTS